MSDCGFDIEDKVAVGALCGTVVDKKPLGDGWILKVRLPNGQTVPLNCADARPCRENRVVCGAPTRSGRSCRRVVSDAGERCYQHK